MKNKQKHFKFNTKQIFNIYYNNFLIEKMKTNILPSEELFKSDNRKNT